MNSTEVHVPTAQKSALRSHNLVHRNGHAAGAGRREHIEAGINKGPDAGLGSVESTWYPGPTEQHADHLVVTSLPLIQVKLSIQLQCNIRSQFQRLITKTPVIPHLPPQSHIISPSSRITIHYQLLPAHLSLLTCSMPQPPTSLSHVFFSCSCTVRSSSPKLLVSVQALHSCRDAALTTSMCSKCSPT